jgi:hypothetical protein
MASRTFTAPDGTPWQAWSVIPGDHSDWPTHARNQLPGALAGGWLAFECLNEKRRLSPIPPDWEDGSEADLWAHCLAAAPVRRRTTGPDPEPVA